MEIKPYKAKVKIAGGSLAVIVPAWVKGAFDVNKGDEVVVKLEKINKDSSQPQDNGPVV